MELGRLEYVVETDQSKLQKEIDRSRDAITRLQEMLKKVDDAHARGVMTADQHAEATRRFNDQIESLEHNIGMANAGMVRMQGGAGLASQRVVEMGRAFEDVFVTGSPIGAINNINREFELMAQQGRISAGALLGLNIATAVLGVGLNALINHWQDIVGLFSKGSQDVTESVDSIKARIKEIESHTVRPQVESEELERLKKLYDKIIKAQNDYAAMQGKQTIIEARSGKLAEEAIVETPGARAAIESARQEAAKGAESSPEVQAAKKELAAAEAGTRILGMSPEAAIAAGRRQEKAQKALDGARAKASEKANNEFVQMVDDAQHATGARLEEAQKKLADTIGKASPELAEKLRGAAPAKIEERDALLDEMKEREEQLDAEIAAFRRTSAKFKHAQEKDKQLARELTEQGAENERRMREEQEREAEREKDHDEREHAKKVTHDARLYGARLGNQLAIAMIRGLNDVQLTERVAEYLRHKGLMNADEIAAVIVAGVREQFNAGNLKAQQAVGHGMGVGGGGGGGIIGGVIGGAAGIAGGGAGVGLGAPDLVGGGLFGGFGMEVGPPARGGGVGRSLAQKRRDAAAKKALQKIPQNIQRAIPAMPPDQGPRVKIPELHMEPGQLLKEGAGGHAANEMKGLKDTNDKQLEVQQNMLTALQSIKGGVPAVAV